MIQAEQRTVYVARHTTKDGRTRRKTCLTKQGAASAIAWWIIFDKRSNDDGIMDQPKGYPCTCEVTWAGGIPVYARDYGCESHGSYGYYHELHKRFTRYILKAGG